MLIFMLRYVPSLKGSVILAILALAVQSINFPKGFAQAPEPQAHKAETVQDLLGKLTPEQKQLFDQGTKAFSAQHYADALAVFKQMLTLLQGDPVISKFASEAALDVGETSFAVATLTPLAATDPDDWQGSALLTRACAESGDTTCRDSGMAHMLDLYRRGIVPPGVQQYVLERVKSGKNTLVIRTSIVPWGNYKIYDSGQVLDNDGQVFLRITLESADAEQAQFAKEHPKEAAKGIRSFSLDAYRETGLNGNGQRTQTHYAYRLFVGQPSYETIRDEFIKIAGGKASAISSRTNLIVP